MIKNIFILFYIGHILGDFYLQSNNLAIEKETKFHKLLEHGLIYLISMFIVIVIPLGFGYIKWAILAASLHILIDGIKFCLNTKNIINDKHNTYIYFVDQFLHLICIIVVVLLILKSGETLEFNILFNKLTIFIEYLDLNINELLAWLLALMIIIKPAGITINITLNAYQPTENQNKENEKGHPGAGNLIGIFERLIILIMISQKEYAAIGFVLTAKSIARYNKIVENPQFAEYYLLGTLLSFLIVIVTHFIFFI